MNIWTPQNNIVTNGLILNLDAGIKASYPGSGTTWGDLSPSNYDGTLANGAGFNNTRGGSIVFDGIDDYVDLPVNINTASVTIDIWLKADKTIHSLANYPFSFGAVANLLVGGTYSDASISAKAISLIGNDIVLGGSVANTYTEVDNNLWRNIVATYNPTTGSTIYKNNIAQTLFTNTLGINLSNEVKVNIGRRSDGFWYWDGNISIVRLYNRVLSSLEVTQNFESQRKRFGI